MGPPPLPWSATRERLRADRARLAALLAATRPDVPRCLLLHPSYLCVMLYRVAHHCYQRGHRRCARVLWQFNLLVTGADIAPPADLGPGLVVLYPPGTSIMGNAGRNLTVMACAGLGAETGRRQDIGAGPGICIVGDDVVLEPHSGVLGPVRVGHRVRVGAGVGVTRDVPDDTRVEGPAPRFIAAAQRP